MKIKAVLSQKANGDIKSKVLTPESAELAFDCYLRPDEFAELIGLHGKELELDIITV